MALIGWNLGSKMRRFLNMKAGKISFPDLQAFSSAYEI